MKAAVAEKKEAIKQESKRRNMFGSKRDGSYWRNKKRAANSLSLIHISEPTRH